MALSPLQAVEARTSGPVPEREGAEAYCAARHQGKSPKESETLAWQLIVSMSTYYSFGSAMGTMLTGKKQMMRTVLWLASRECPQYFTKPGKP